MARFLAEGDRICTEMDSKSLELTAMFESGEANALEQAALISANADLLSDSIDRLRRLEQPSAHFDELAEIYESADALANKSRELSKAMVSAGPAEVAVMAREGQELQADLNERFDEFGLAKCGSM